MRDWEKDKLGASERTQEAFQEGGASRAQKAVPCTIAAATAAFEKTSPKPSDKTKEAIQSSTIEHQEPGLFRCHGLRLAQSRSPLTQTSSPSLYLPSSLNKKRAPLSVALSLKVDCCIVGDSLFLPALDADRLLRLLRPLLLRDLGARGFPPPPGVSVAMVTLLRSVLGRRARPSPRPWPRAWEATSWTPR